METVQAAGDAATVSTAPAPRVLEIRFTGSGSEYFRIWAVNLLLIVLSCGLYLPFAKTRRIRYLYANTLIDGEALAFHGDAWRMLRGFLLLAVLMVAYTVAGEFSPAAALPAFLLLCAVWPALWRAAMQFRLANTSWRGLRLGFEGSLGGAYAAYLPVFVPWALTVALTPGDGRGPSEDPSVNASVWFSVSVIAAGLLAPWSAALIKRYQHNGYRIADEQGRIHLRLRSVYFIAFKTLLLGLMMGIAMAFASVLVGSVLALVSTGKIDGKGNGAFYSLAFLGLVYLQLGAVMLPYYTARLQNLVWGNTRSSSLRFQSDLTGLVRLTVKNWLLIVATLGLYRPFAVINTVSKRLQSIRIETSSNPQTWMAPPTRLRTDASGEVAGDFFGVDVGL